MTLGFIKQLLRTRMVSDEMLLLVIETGLQTTAVNYGGNVLFPLVQQDNSRTQRAMSLQKFTQLVVTLDLTRPTNSSKR